MNQSNLIIVSGIVCTGKTTVAKKLSETLHIPLVSKDMIKESLFDSLGYSDREYSKKIGVGSYRVMYLFIEELIKNKISLITETAFSSEYDSKIFNNLISKYSPKVLQIVCDTEKTVLFPRFVARSESGERHPGHVDHVNYQEFENKLKSEEYVPLDIAGRTIKIDTTNLDTIDYEGVLGEIGEM